MKTTLKDLQNAVNHCNQWFVENGSNYFFREQGRNGYQAVDLGYFDENGKEKILQNVECGTSREVLAAIDDCFDLYQDKRYGKVTRKTAKSALESIGFNFAFKDDFSQFGVVNLSTLESWAKLTNYRAPKNKNGSTGRYFFNNLTKY